MRTIMTVGSALVLALGVIALLTGCGRLIEPERAHAPTIRSVVLENTTSLNYPVMVGNTLSCRANIDTRHGTAEATAAFVIGSTTRAVVMSNGVASLVVTPDMVGAQTSAYCVVSAHVRDSRTKVRRSNDLQVYPATYGYRLPCGLPTQQPQLNVCVGQGGVSVNYRRN